MSSREIIVLLYLVMTMAGFIAFDLGMLATDFGHPAAGLIVMGALQIALGSWRALSLMDDKPKPA